MVYVGAIVYKQKNWEASVDAGSDLKLTFTDTKGNKLAERQLKSDEFGVISDSVLLPKDAVPGSYRIRIGDKSYSVRVEEYRRPTFSVEMDPTPAISLPADSICVTGKAVTYSGVPVVNARVTGIVKFYSGFWLQRVSTNDKEAFDTIYTDAEGRFSIPVSLDYIKKNDLSYTIHYKEQGTEKELHRLKTVSDKLYNSEFTETAETITGYNLVGNNTQTIK